MDMKIDNIYALISIISFLCVFAGLFIFSVIRKVNMSLSKSGIVLTSKSGIFIKKDILEDYRDLVVSEQRLKNEIIKEQMILLERGTVVFYNRLLKNMKSKIENKRLFSLFKVSFDLHRLRILNTFKHEIIYNNHFLLIDDFDHYKREMFQYTTEMSSILFNDIFNDFDLSENEEIEESIKDEARQILAEFFYAWMDKLKKITAEKTTQINSVRKKRKSLVDASK